MLLTFRFGFEFRLGFGRGAREAAPRLRRRLSRYHGSPATIMAASAPET